MSNKVLSFVLWLVVTVFMVGGIGTALQGSYLSAAFMALGGLLCVPPIVKKIKTKAPVKVLLPIAMFFVAAAIAPMSSEMSIPKNETKPVSVSAPSEPEVVSSDIQEEPAYTTTLPPDLPEESDISTTVSVTESAVTTVSTTCTSANTGTGPITSNIVLEDSVTDTLKKLDVHFIDVGQGDAIYISCAGHNMLIDAGDNSKGSTVRYYLKKLGVTELDYVIGTHPDADHIGGLDVVIENFDCKTIIMPNISSDTATYRDVIDAIKWMNNKITYPVVGTTYFLGDASFKVLAPISYNYGEDKNNYSVAIMLSHGDKRFLFTGDCEKEAEADMIRSGIDLKADVYKAGHHGSNSSSSSEFLKAIAPDVTVISCGKDNSYGHPHKSTLNRITAVGSIVYRTDEQGTLIATSDGKQITWNVSSSGSLTPGVYQPEQNLQTATSTTKPQVTISVPENINMF